MWAYRVSAYRGRSASLRTRAHEAVAALGRMVRWRPLASPPGVHRQECSPRRNMGALLPRPRRAAYHCCCPATSASNAKIKRVNVPCPGSTPALYAIDRHHLEDVRGEQRQRVKSAFTDPQGAGASVQRRGVEVLFRAGEVIVTHGFRDLLCCPHGTPVEIHQAPLRRRVREDHAATAPIPGGMRPGTRRRIAYTYRYARARGMPRWLQVRFATAAGQSSLEGGELLGQVGACWSKRTLCWWTCRYEISSGWSVETGSYSSHICGCFVASVCKTYRDTWASFNLIDSS